MRDISNIHLYVVRVFIIIIFLRNNILFKFHLLKQTR